MEFCPKCGILLKKKEEKFICLKCGYTKGAVSIKTSEKIPEKKSISIIEKEESSLPEIDIQCEKCGNKKAYFWQIQTRGADESPTNFFRCTKCKHTWRQYT
ncbi:MAG: transcription factor S [Candidatus Pacearchaeota archaeon]